MTATVDAAADSRRTERLTRRFVAIALKRARRMARRFPTVDLDEAESRAMAAAVRAVKVYQQKDRTRAETFAAAVVDDELRRSWERGQLAADRLRQFAPVDLRTGFADDGLNPTDRRGDSDGLAVAEGEDLLAALLASLTPAQQRYVLNRVEGDYTQRINHTAAVGVGHTLRRLIGQQQPTPQAPRPQPFPEETDPCSL